MSSLDWTNGFIDKSLSLIANRDSGASILIYRTGIIVVVPTFFLSENNCVLRFLNSETLIFFIFQSILTDQVLISEITLTCVISPF